MEEYSLLRSPVKYGKIVLKNRIIFAPTTMGLRGEEYYKKLEDLAAGGCAMIVIGDVPIRKSRFGFSLFSKAGQAHYQKITDLAHCYDCKVSAQLHQNDTRFKGMLRYVPGMITGKLSAMELRRIVNEKTGEYISGIPKEEVQKITASFAEAAKQAVKLGFDAVMIHGDRMCGSFSSSLMNHREDEYGGSVENRTRFAVEAVRAVRESLPDLSIDYKLAVRQEHPHYGNAGVLVEELPVFVPALEEAGVNSFHVALADHGKLEDTIPPADHEEFKGQGCFLKFSDEVKKYTNLPVCAVGGLSDPDFIEAQLETGRIDCAAMSRQLIADPNWVRKVENLKVEQIKKCIRCNKKCLGGMYEHKGVHCIYEEGSI